MEAVIAILLVLGFLLYIIPKTPVMAEPTTPEGLDSARNYILTRFLTDNELRSCVGKAIVAKTDIGPIESNKCMNAMGEDEECKSKIETLLSSNTPSGFKYHCEICLNTNPCTSLPGITMEKAIYPGALFMYFSGRTPPSRYIRIYFWKE